MTNNRAIVIACKPYHWKEEFLPSFKLGSEEVIKVKEKWRHLFE